MLSDLISIYYSNSKSLSSTSTLKNHINHFQNSDGVFILEECRTGCYAARLEVADSALAGVIQDSSIHAALSPEMVRFYEFKAPFFMDFEGIIANINFEMLFFKINFFSFPTSKCSILAKNRARNLSVRTTALYQYLDFEKCALWHNFADCLTWVDRK